MSKLHWRRPNKRDCKKKFVSKKKLNWLRSVKSKKRDLLPKPLS